jgi:hypothetical protein
LLGEGFRNSVKVAVEMERVAVRTATFRPAAAESGARPREPWYRSST